MSAPALAQDYPTHVVRLITDSAPGSSIDVPVRIIAEGLSKIWGQQAVVINQPGAGGAIAARAAATAIPDGYTFGMPAVSAFVALPGDADNLPIEVPRSVAATSRTLQALGEHAKSAPLAGTGAEAAAEKMTGQLRGAKAAAEEAAGATVSDFLDDVLNAVFHFVFDARQPSGNETSGALKLFF